MPRIRYQVAMSLDGYIAGPNGEADWIIMDPEIDFTALFAQFDTFLIGRRTFETMGSGAGSMGKGTRTYVFSKTLLPGEHRKVTVVPEVSAATVDAIRAQAKKDIWLFGGGTLFKSFLEAGLIDNVEVTVIPVLLGGGIPLVLPPARQTKLALTGHRVYGTGIVSLEYAIAKEAPKKRSRSTKKRRS